MPVTLLLCRWSAVAFVWGLNSISFIMKIKMAFLIRFIAAAAATVAGGQLSIDVWI